MTSVKAAGREMKMFGDISIRNMRTQNRRGEEKLRVISPHFRFVEEREMSYIQASVHAFSYSCAYTWIRKQRRNEQLGLTVWKREGSRTAVTEWWRECAGRWRRLEMDGIE
jgi:hypothetical protein